MGGVGMIGAPAYLTISEPWEFEDEVGTGAISGRVREVVGAEVSVELDSPVTFSGTTIACLRAVARYEGESAADADAEDIVCNFAPVGDEGGGGATHLIGTLRVG